MMHFSVLPKHLKYFLFKDLRMYKIINYQKQLKLKGKLIYWTLPLSTQLLPCVKENIFDFLLEQYSYI